MPKSHVGGTKKNGKKLSPKERIKEMGKRKQGAGAANRGHKKGQGSNRAGTSLPHSNASSKPGRTAPNGETRVKGSHYRTEGTIRRLAMYRDRPNIRRMKEQPNKPMRIQPDRRWFGNTRVIAQDKMQAFRETIAKKVEDPFSVVLKSSKLPMSLLTEVEDKSSRMDLLSISPFSEAFGKKKQQKKPKLLNYDLQEFCNKADERADEYDGTKDKRSLVDDSTGLEKPAAPIGEDGRHLKEEIFDKGTSRRIWGELWKVVDSSDVLVEVLDARDPMGTRCRALERAIRRERPNKHIMFVLNKVDLVPTWVSRKWIQVLMKEFPTIAFHASITNPFGKNSLLNLFRQFSTLMKDKKHVTIGLIGYPNVGKSSVINTLRRKKVCKAAPIPGETRIWQYIALTRRLYLLDCPGIVPPTAQDFAADCAKVLKGVVRAERIKIPSDYIDEVLSRVKRAYLLQRYKLPGDTTWEDGEGFLEVLGRKMGKLKKGGDPDIDVVARIVLNDWQRGRIPFFTPPPEIEAEEEKPKKQPQQPAPAADPSDAVGDESKVEAIEDGQEAEKAKEGDKEGGEKDEEQQEGPDQTVEMAIRELAVAQPLGDLKCCLEYDNDDRRGEDPPEKKQEESAADPKAKAKAEAKAKAKAGSSKARGNKKRKRTVAGDGDAADAPAAKKERRWRRSGDAPKASKEKAGGKSATVKPGSMDWHAVVAEFGM